MVSPTHSRGNPPCRAAIAPWLALLLGALAAGSAARADEGMWTFDHFPSDVVERGYGVRIDQRWLDRVRQSVVRLSGCTGSFVSPGGLILTNHHCVESCLAQHSTREKSLIESGVFARSRDEELRCETQIADVLVELEPITPRVAEAVRGLDARAAKERRRETLTRLEQECEDTSRKSGKPLKCEAVTLYGGGQYWLYKYHRYTDVRLAFTPEDGIAAFGGDPDNFQFPRWCLDFALLRAYEQGRPAATPIHFSIDFAGPMAGEPVFVAGHPGSTDRQLTVAELQSLRNDVLPQRLLRDAELRGRYIQFAQAGEAQERIVRDALNGLENRIKVERKLLDALLDDAMMLRKHDEEVELRLKVEREQASGGASSDPWARIEAALRTEAAFRLPYTYIEQGAGFNSRLFRYARTLVRVAAERAKPNTERLREYTEAALPRIEQQLGARVPVYPELERLTLSFSLERMREWLGPDYPTVRRLLANDSPESLAASLVDGSKLADPEARLALYRGGSDAIERSTDPMIVLARSIDPEARALRKREEDEVEAPIELAHEEIAAARFAALGTSVYPDATFTLRLNYGTVRGWNEPSGAVPPFTHVARLYERATGRPPFALPDSWKAARESVGADTPFNLVSDNDIVGGNSGSPLIDGEGNIVGLIFDGNIHSISGAYWFDPDKNRAVSVDMAIIREALDKVYGAHALLREISASR